MADVFISYAREDQETVRLLHRALAERDRETWVDWEGIAPSDEWLTSILEAIDNADAFVCVLSPDWLASEICRREADHAIAANKRLIPVVAREPAGGTDVPEAIAGLNWIFARSESEIGTATSRIVEALETDPDAIRTHTLVHARSKAWELAGRRRSILLRGDELQRAEAWVARAAGGTRPQPTVLQAAFVAASRSAARGRMRLALGGAIAVAVVSSVLAVLALVSRSQAIHQTRVAEAQALTAESASTLDADPELALLLAQQALHRDDDAASRLAFVTAFDQTKVRRILRWGGAGGVNAVAWSPHGSIAAVGGQDGSIALWNPATGTVLHRLEAGAAGVDALAFSPDGTLLASGGGDRLVRLWNVATGAPVRTCTGHTGLVNSLAFSVKGDAVVSGSDDGTARVWVTASCREVGVLRDGGHITGVAVAPGNRFVATVDTTDGATKLWTLGKDGWGVARTARAPAGEASIQVAISPDGKEIATSTTDGTVRLWDWETEKEPRVVGRSSDLLVAVAMSPDGSLVAASGNDTAARIWDVATRDLVQTLRGNRGTVSGLAFSPDGHSILTGGGDGTARVFQVKGGLNALQSAIAADGPLVSEAVSATDGLVVASTYGRATAWALDGSRRWELALPSRYAFLVTAFDAHGTVLAGMFKGRIDVVRPRDGRVLRSIPTPHAFALALSGDGSVLATGGTDGVVRVYRTATGRLVASRRLSNHLGYLFSAAFSPDGRLLALGTGTGPVLLLDTTTLRQVRELSGPTAPVSALSFDHAGTLLAGGSADKRAWLWQVADGAVARTFQGHTDGVDAVAISPDDTLLATGGNDHTARIWNLRTGDEMRLLSGDLEAVTGVAFAQGGDTLVSSSLDGTLRIWDSCAWCLSPAQLEAHATIALARCLTPDERERYLGEQDARREACAA